MSAVWERSRQSGGALLVLLAIADHADDAGCAFPSVGTLAKKARLTERQTWNVIRELRATGELAVETGGGRGRSNRYRITLKNPEANFDETGNSENNSLKSATQNPEICDKGKPETLKSATKNPETHIRGTIREPSDIREPSEIRHTGADAPRRKTAKSHTTWPDGFCLTLTMRGYAETHGVTPDAEFAAWRDDCHAHSRRYADWEAAWRTRIRNVPKFAGARRNGMSPRGVDAVMAVARDLAAGEPRKLIGGGS